MARVETGVSLFDSILDFIYGPPKKKKKLSHKPENSRHIQPEDSCMF